MKIRKHLFIYLWHLVFLFLFARNVSNIEYAEIRVIDIINMVGTLAMLSLAINILFNPYFIIVDGEDFKIAKYFFGYYKFKKSDIESIEEAEGYSFKIHINLKNGKRITISINGHIRKDKSNTIEYN